MEKASGSFRFMEKAVSNRFKVVGYIYEFAHILNNFCIAFFAFVQQSNFSRLIVSVLVFNTSAFTKQL